LEPFVLFDKVCIDWNVALRSGNEYFNGLVAAARSPLLDERQQNSSQLVYELETRTDFSEQPLRLVWAAFSRHTRNTIVADDAVRIYASALPMAVRIQDRANLHLELTRVAAALALYRAE
jgi:hypothetical protein